MDARDPRSGDSMKADPITPEGVLVTDAPPESDDWLAARRGGITGTDLPKILGLTKYGNALSVWLDKRGELDDAAGEAARWGNLLEDPVAQEWAARHGAKVERVGVLANTERPWVRASLDRLVVHGMCPDGGFDCGLEVKTRSAFKADEYRSGVPDDVLAQVEWGLIATGLHHMHVAVLIGGQRMESLRVDRDEQVEAYLLDALKTDYQVNFELSGKGGLEFAHRYQPDLILLDAMMPDMDGFSVCTELRAHAETSAIPIIFVTARESPEDEARALEIGASDFMAKPVNLAVLCARVRTQLTLKRHCDMLRSLTLTDPLTGILNRRAFDQTIVKQWRRCGASQKPLSMILADLDHFKAFNDVYGHPAGDDCLRAVAKVFGQAAQRPQDLVARYGGEEFVILLPELDLPGAEIVAGRVILGLKALNMDHAASDTASRVTASLGVASIVPALQAPEILLSTADTFLYRAKDRGRDQFVSGIAGV